MAEMQRTIANPIKLVGVGLHTGEKVNMEILPAKAGHGYKFQRIDLEGEPFITADCDLVVSTDRGTTLEQNGAK
ncbi:MAG: UDP-3-O-acyl-N-acetylglucosamine deacetylase, partial [Flavobacteriales bacterium]